MKISVGGNIFFFEDPMPMYKRTGEELRQPPTGFLGAVSLWCQQGKRIEGGLCRWDHEPEPILKWFNKSSAFIVGYRPAKRGE